MASSHFRSRIMIVFVLWFIGCICCDGFRFARFPQQRLLRPLLAGKVGESLQNAPSNAEDMAAIRMQLPRPIPLLDDPLLPIVKAIAKNVDLRKATSVLALRVSHITEITQFMLIVEGGSTRQLGALSSAVTEVMYPHFGHALKEDGSSNSGWEVLDYGSVVVHLMTPMMRAFYKLEKRWAQGEVVDLSDVLTPGSSEDPVQHQGGAEEWLDGGVLGHQGEPSAHPATSNARPKGAVTASAEDVAFWGSEEGAEVHIQEDATTRPALPGKGRVAKQGTGAVRGTKEPVSMGRVQPKVGADESGRGGTATMRAKGKKVPAPEVYDDLLEEFYGRQK